MTANIYIHDYNSHLKDKLGQETIGTTETEKRKMSSVKHLLSKKIWIVMKIHPHPALERLNLN